MLCQLFVSFSEGSNLTPAHHYPDFRFKNYAPLAFRYFRELFGIKPDDYLVRPRNHTRLTSTIMKDDEIIYKNHSILDGKQIILRKQWKKKWLLNFQKI